MKKTILFLLFTIALQAQHIQKMDTVLVCDVKFHDSQFDNTHAGSGFLLEYGGKVYACTAKHVLFFAKTDQMQTISFGEGLKSWDFVSKRVGERSITAGTLVNENREEPLAMPPTGDWLIFETDGEIGDGILVFKLRKEPLAKGEVVFFMGYPYKSTAPIRVAGKFKGYTPEGNLSLDVPKGIYNGCSGGPVFDQKNRLVGLVSLGYIDQKTDTMVFEPASTEYFIKQIK